MKSLAELQAIKEKMQSQIGLRNETGAKLVLLSVWLHVELLPVRPVLTTLSELVHEKNLQDVSATQAGWLVCASMNLSLRY